MKPGNSEVLSYLGYVKRRQGNYQECIDYLLEAYQSDPLSSNIPFTLGETYELQREYEQAISFFDRGILLSPEWHGSYAQKAHVMFEYKGDIDSSISVLKASLQKIAFKDVSLYELANFYYLNGEYENALITLKELKESDLTEQFKYHSKYKLKGDIYLAKGQNKESMIYYDSARIHIESRVEENPREPKYRSLLGMVYARLGMHDEAVKEGLLATQLMPESLDAWAGYERQIDLARIYSIAGKQDLAFKKIDYLLSTPGNFSKNGIELDPEFNNLRNSDGYNELLEKQY